MKILKAKLAELDELFQIYLDAKKELEINEIFQWTENYPVKETIEEDIQKGFLYTLTIGDEIVGAICINEEQDVAYQTIKWEFDDRNVLVVHRLVVAPKHQRKGYAGELMDYVEKFAQQEGYSSIRLDAYIPNKGSVGFYERRNYKIRGNVNFSGRTALFHCMEKEIKK